MVMVVPMVTYELSEQELNWSSDFFFPFSFKATNWLPSIA